MDGWMDGWMEEWMDGRWMEGSLVTRRNHTCCAVLRV